MKVQFIHRFQRYYEKKANGIQWNNPQFFIVWDWLPSLTLCHKGKKTLWFLSLFCFELLLQFGEDEQ